MPLAGAEASCSSGGATREKRFPPLFGLEFSTAIWNAGFVKRPGHIFLLATLDKSGHGAEFQYQGPFHQPQRVRVAKPESNDSG